MTIPLEARGGQGQLTAPLAVLEAIIERGLATFVEVGTALLSIRDQRLYRERSHATFEDYCLARWGFTRRQGDRLIEAAQVADTLRPIGLIPHNEAQARELAPLMRQGEEEVIAVWRGLRAQHGDQVTARLVRDAVERRLHIQEVRQRPEAPPIPAGLFDIIYADPPWQYSNQIEKWGPTSLHYPTMELADMAALKVPVADNATLFLWATNPMLADALELAEAWGFTYKTNIVWVKRNLERPGAGFYVRGRHELLFICTKGSHVPDQRGREPIGSVLEADVREHSRKPDEVYGVIERMYPGARYLELFARRAKREGWTMWGNE